MSADVPTLVRAATRALRSGGALPPATMAALRAAEPELAAELEALAEDVAARTAAAERAEKEFQAFLYRASHDLQEPARKIASFSQMIEEECGAALQGDCAMYLDRMRKAGARLQALLDGLLAYSRVATRGQPLEAVTTDEIARTVVSQLSDEIAAIGAVVEIGAMPPVTADPVQLGQLLHELLANALKFRRPGQAPRIAMSAEAAGDSVALRIADDGIGFEPAQAERIFGLFERLHNRETYPGVGIGLAVCRRIAERHGGSLSAAAAPGAGAVFTLVLPRAPE